MGRPMQVLASLNGKILVLADISNSMDISAKTRLLHSLLHMESLERLHSTIFLGASWEGYVIEQVLSSIDAGWQAGF